MIAILKGGIHRRKTMTIKATISNVYFQEKAMPSDYQGIGTTTSEDAAAKIGYRYFEERPWLDSPGSFRTYWDFCTGEWEQYRE